jgi:hypothetical protein
MNMPSSRAVASLAAVAILGVAAVASTATRSSADQQPQSAAVYSAPLAQASGGDVPLPIPSIVNTNIVRAQAALDRAVTAIDQGQNATALPEFVSVATNVNDAWAAAQYVIETAPPPVEASAGSVAHTSGGAVVGASAFAAPEDTAFAVLALQEQIITTAVGVIDQVDADPATLPYLRKMARAAIKGRATAINYIAAIPAPPAEASPQAKPSGGAVVGGNWAAVMPNLVPLLDDEMQIEAGTIAIDTTLSAKTQKTLTNWSNAAAAVEVKVNTLWPPVPAG